jgi:hypothetical protein
MATKDALGGFNVMHQLKSSYDRKNLIQDSFEVGFRNINIP